MASTPLRRRYSSAADLSAPPPATAAPAAPAPRRSGLDRAHSFLDLSPTAPAAATTATTAVPAVSAQPSAASLPRRTSFSGTGLLHSRSQSLLDVRAHRNSIAGDPRVGQMMERRQRGLSKLRGLVIPEKVPELPVLLPDLPEIKSVPPPTATTRSSWSPSPAVGGHRTTNWNQSGAPPVIRPASWQPQNTSSSQWNHLNGVKPSNPPSTNLKSSWSQSTVNNRETSRPSWSSTASVPKYSPAFKRKSLSLSSSVSSSLSSSREELRPLFDSNSNNQPPPLPPSKPPPLLPPTEPKSLESIASSPTRSDISFEYKVGSIKSPVTTPDADILTSNSKGGGGDESDDSAVSSSRSSQYSPPSSPMRKMLTSSTESSVYTSRVLKPRSVEAINRKNVLSSARHSSGRDLKAGSPLIQRKMPDESEDTKNEINSSVLVPTDDCNDDIVQGTDEFIHNYKDKSAEKYGMDDQLNKNEDSNRILLSKTDGVSSGAFRNIDSQETTETNIGNSGKNTANTQYKTEEKIFTTAHANVEQKNNVMHQKIDDRIAMMHHRVDDKSNTVIQRSMEIITTVVNNNAEDKLHGVQREISKDALPNSVRDGDSLTQQRRLYTSEERSDIEMLDDHHDSEEKNNKFSTNRNRFETDDSSKHQFAIARRKFEESSAHKVRPSSLKNEGSKIMTSQKKSDDNSAILRRQDAIDDITLEMNGNDLSLDGKSRPVAAPRRYVAQWEATQSNKASPVSSPVSPVFPAVPPKPVSKMSNGNAGGIYRQDSTATIIKHARGSSLDSTASDDNTLRDSVLYGSVSSLSSASSIITPQELQQLMNEANQSLDESGVSSPVMLEVVVLHRDVAGGGIGITLAGGADYEAKEITVHKVLAGSPADRDGRLQKGDRILSINGHNMKGVTHQESLRILKSPSPEVVLVVMKKGPEGVSSPTFDESSYGRKATTFRTLEQLKENSTETPMEANALLDGDERGPPVNLVLCKDGAGLGFSLDGGRDSPLGDRPLTVKKIFTGGAAEKQGQLKAGDELLSVAGFDVTSMTRIEAWTLMKKLPSGPVTICVRPKTVV